MFIKYCIDEFGVSCDKIDEGACAESTCCDGSPASSNSLEFLNEVSFTFCVFVAAWKSRARLDEKTVVPFTGDGEIEMERDADRTTVGEIGEVLTIVAAFGFMIFAFFWPK
jgi:hypothetical protein